MKLAFCVIAKGDEELSKLKTLLNSVDDVFQGVFITTNHEHKKTEEWCKEQGYNHSHLPWSKDFSAQRNFNFNQVPPDFDYIVWADADDIIINPHVLTDIARIAKSKNYDTVFFTYWYGNKFNGIPSKETFVDNEIKQMRERLIKPGSITWKKRLHESPVPIDGEHYTYSTVKYSKEYPIAWMHLGAERNISDEAMEERMKRNRELLELDLADERKAGNVDPRTLLYLMKIYAEEDDRGTLEECIYMGEEYLEKSGWDQERAVCLRLMATCFGKLGQHKKANTLLHRAIAEYERDPLLYLHLARTYYNLKDFSAMKHWLEIGLSIKDNEHLSMENVLELKTLSAQLMLQYYLYGPDKSVRKAWEAAMLLYKSDPTETNKQNEEYLFNQKELDLACEAAHKLMIYYKDIEREELIPKVFEAMPIEMRELPFAQTMYNKYKEPKVWGEKEICYFANFGGEHFEKWSPHSLKNGIGGSETAVIELARRWAKDGWKVTVYGDPGAFQGDHEGVIYLPWYKFNQRDHFNIFIAWRRPSYLGKIVCKKYLLDMHDVFIEQTVNKQGIDRIMVKSEFHKSLAPHTERMQVISNGI